MALSLTRTVQPPVEAKERIWRVEVQEAEPATLSPTLALYGEVETPNLLKAAAPADALVETVSVKDGDRVRPGQPLLRLDERDFRPRLDQVQADVAELEAQIQSEQNRHRTNLTALDEEKRMLALAGAEVERARRLKERKLGSDSAVDEAGQAQARQALAVISRENDIRDHDARLARLRAGLQRAEARVSEVQLELERSRVTAPFSALISRVAVSEGDRAKRGDVLLELYDPGTLEIRARIPAPYRDELVEALQARAPVTGRGRVGGGSLLLTLDRISGAASPQGVDALFHIDQGRQWLRPGDTVQFALQRTARADAIALPYQALYGADRAYLLEDGRMKAVQIEPLGSWLGPDGAERLLIRSAAIRAGDLIVTTHLPNAVTGLRAEVAAP